MTSRSQRIRNSSDFNRGRKNQPWEKKIGLSRRARVLARTGRTRLTVEWKRGIGIVGLRWPAGWQWNRATVNELIAGTIIIPRSRAPLRPRRLLADYESIVASVINPSHPLLHSCPRIDGQRRNLSSRARSPLSWHICDSFGISLPPLDGSTIVTDFFFPTRLSCVFFFFFWGFNEVNEINGKINIVVFFIITYFS